LVGSVFFSCEVVVVHARTHTLASQICNCRSENHRVCWSRGTAHYGGSGTVLETMSVCWSKGIRAVMAGQGGGVLRSVPYSTQRALVVPTGPWPATQPAAEVGEVCERVGGGGVLYADLRGRRSRAALARRGTVAQTVGWLVGGPCGEQSGRTRRYIKYAPRHAIFTGPCLPRFRSSAALPGALVLIARAAGAARGLPQQGLQSQAGRHF
jgi:hypothetical protein